MKKRPFLSIACALLLYSSVHATSGIAVSSRSHDYMGKFVMFVNNGSWGDTLWRYNIDGDQVATAEVLYSGKARYPAFNVQGTHVAFFNAKADGDYISVIELSTRVVRDIIKIESEKGILEWPIGDDLYFTIGSKEELHPRTVYKVNVSNPGVKQQVISTSYPIFQGGLSADGNYGHFTEDNGYGRHAMVISPARQGQVSSAGCGSAISPSGTYFCNWEDGSHETLHLYRFDWTLSTLSRDNLTKITPLLAVDYNTWVANANGYAVACGSSTFQVGMGGYKTRWSANSDKWICMDMGWPYGGRYAICSNNQVLLNWDNQKVINVTRHPRKCQDAAKDAECDQVADRLRIAESGDFFVTGPIEEILPDLRQYFSTGSGGFQTSSRPHRPASTRLITRDRIRTDESHTAGAPTSLYDTQGRRIWTNGRVVDTADLGSSATFSSSRVLVVRPEDW